MIHKFHSISSCSPFTTQLHLVNILRKWIKPQVESVNCINSHVISARDVTQKNSQHTWNKLMWHKLYTHAGFSDSLGLCYVEGVLLLFLPTNSKIVDTTKHQFQHFLVVSRASGWTTGQFAKHQTTGITFDPIWKYTAKLFHVDI